MTNRKTPIQWNKIDSLRGKSKITRLNNRVNRLVDKMHRMEDLQNSRITLLEDYLGIKVSKLDHEFEISRSGPLSKETEEE